MFIEAMVIILIINEQSDLVLYLEFKTLKNNKNKV